MAGGTLANATVQQLIKATNVGGTLNGVTLKGIRQTQPVLLDVRATRCT
jgi:hypothetical protein